MGRKKFRLVVRKNEERRKCAAAPTSLVMSISTAKLPVQSLDAMAAQLAATKALPPSWIVQAPTAGLTEPSRKMVICCLETASETPAIRHSITLREDLLIYWCFQVLSESVYTAMLLVNDPWMRETRRFVCMFDRFFDCLNVSNFTDGKFDRKVFRQPYRSSNDFRLKVCKISCDIITPLQNFHYIR